MDRPVFSHGVESYVPELFFLEEKDASGCRICREDCAVIDTNNGYRVVAFRGLHKPDEGDYFRFLGVSSSNVKFIKDALSQWSRVVVPCKTGVLLIFGDLLAATGLLVVIKPHGSCGKNVDEMTASVCRALMLMDRRDMKGPESALLAAGTPRKGDEELCKYLSELLYYMDSIGKADPLASGVWTLSLRIANFAGCRLDRAGLPATAVDCPSLEQKRLAAFLLCAFLTLRQRSGAVYASSEAPEHEDQPLRYRVEQSPYRAENESVFPGMIPTKQAKRISDDEQQTQLQKEFLFLSCDCFQSFTLARTDGGGVAVEAVLRRSPKAMVVSAFGGEKILLKINIATVAEK